MQLRPYQTKSISALWKFFRENPRGAPLISAPTGSGKSYIIATICQQIIEQRPHYRIIVATHVKELVEQNAAELQRLLPTEPVGIYSAGLGQKRIRRITFAGIQSVWKANVDCNLLIIDEAHRLSSSPSSMYQKFIRRLGPNVKIVGLTATPYRMDRGSLVGDIFTDIAYDIGVRELITDGYLSPLISQAHEGVDLKGVKKVGGDYVLSELEEKFSPLVKHHCEEIIKHGANRKSWLVFCSGVKHARDVADCLQTMGISATHVSGDLFSMDRDRRIEDFKSGNIRALTNCDILTTGFNHPPVDLLVLLRSTQSTGLFVQMLGRGMRTSAGKDNCLVLDYGSNLDLHGPIDCIEVRAKKKGEPVEVVKLPTKKCARCLTMVAIKVMICPHCGEEFTRASCILEVKPSVAPILSTVQQFKVTGWNAKVGQKDGKQPYFRFEFQCGLNLYMSYFLFFEHSWAQRQDAIRKWEVMGGSLPAPKTCLEAKERVGELNSFEAVTAIKKGKYYDILSVVGEKRVEIEGLNI